MGKKPGSMRWALALAGASGVLGGGAPAVAVEWDLYGRAHVAGSYLDDDDGYSAVNYSSNSSRVGGKGSYEFSPALTGIFQFEGQIDFDTGDNDELTLTGRDTFVGFEGAWGRARAGHISTPVKGVRSSISLFGDQLGDARAVIRGNYGGHQGFDERFKNSIQYETPEFGGLSLAVHYSVETQTSGNAADDNANDAWSAAARYDAGSLYLAIGYEAWHFDTSAAERDVVRAAAGYQMGPVRVVGLAQRASDPDDDAYGAGFHYAVTERVALKAQSYRLAADDSDLDADLFAIGIEWHYAEPLMFYSNYGMVDNASGQDRDPWTQSSTLERTEAEGGTPAGLAVGLVYKF